MKGGAGAHGDRRSNVTAPHGQVFRLTRTRAGWDASGDQGSGGQVPAQDSSGAGDPVASPTPGCPRGSQEPEQVEIATKRKQILHRQVNRHAAAVTSSVIKKNGPARVPGQPMRLPKPDGFKSNFQRERASILPIPPTLQHAKYVCLTNTCISALAGVAQWTECWLENRKLAGQGTGLGCRPGAQWGRARGNPTLMFLSLPSSLSKNK